MGSRYHLFQRKYKTQAGRESTKWWYWYWDKGVRIRKPAGANNQAPSLKREAQAFIESLERADEVKLAVPPSFLPPSQPPKPSFGSPRTFGDFAADLYQEGAQHLKRKALTEGVEIDESTRKGHRGRLDNYLVPRWGKSAWTAFESESFPDKFTDWLVDLQKCEPRRQGEEARSPAPISNSLRNAIVETMTICLREAKRARLIRFVPELERFKRNSRYQDTLTDKELAQLFPDDRSALERIWLLSDNRDRSTGLLFAAMCCLGISAGMRSGELRAVHVEQIIQRVLPGGEKIGGIIIDKSLDEKLKETSLKKATADDPRTRVVPLSDKTLKILNDYIATIGDRTGLLFLHRGKPVRKETLGRRWAAGLKNAKIDLKGRRMTPHAMRYTYNTRMKMLLSKETLHEVIGHMSDEMTNHYDRPYLEERLYQLSEERSAFNRFWDGAQNIEKANS